jgi:hypothetical protein
MLSDIFCSHSPLRQSGCPIGFDVHYAGDVWHSKPAEVRRMSTDARTWFYTTPEPRPYFIEERVNHTLWKNRLQALSMSCTQPVVPIKMEGIWNGMPVQFEWQPGKYFTLRSGRESKELIGVMRQVLMMRPAVAYTDADGMFVVEWYTDGGAHRWREIQSDARYQHAQRLRKD